ncbi:MAG: rod shape-determining protein MreC [Candidatus Eisenbacteria bacterium]|nr:rod shape-determining protein MreC [Candidatus Eisenbacteria bacterium]
MRLRPRHSVWVLSTLVVLLGLLAVGQRSAVAPIRDAADRALSPLERGTSYLRSFGALKEKNEELRFLATQLAVENFYLKDYRFENHRLRRLLGFLEETRFRLLPVRVVARTGGRAADTWKINKGTRDGIRADMGVVNHRGLVGRIERAEESSASIRTLRNEDLRVSAVDQRSRVVGIFAYRFLGGFRLLDVPASADLKEGDRIVTSGLGGVFPPRIPLGTVKKVERKRGRVFQDVEVEPVVDFSLLEEVYVVLRGEQEGEAPDLIDALPEMRESGAPADEGAVPPSPSRADAREADAAEGGRR